MNVPDWLDSMVEDREFGDVLWNSLIYLEPGPPIGLVTKPVIDFLKRRYYQQTPPPGER